MRQNASCGPQQQPLTKPRSCSSRARSVLRVSSVWSNRALPESRAPTLLPPRTLLAILPVLGRPRSCLLLALPGSLVVPLNLPLPASRFGTGDVGSPSACRTGRLAASCCCAPSAAWHSASSGAGSRFAVAATAWCCRHTVGAGSSCGLSGPTAASRLCGPSACRTAVERASSGSSTASHAPMTRRWASRVSCLRWL